MRADRDQLLSTADGAATTKYGYDANGSLTTRKNGSGTLLFRQGYDLKNRLAEADADGDGDTDLRLAYDHKEGRVARHTLDGTGAVTASEHYLLDRMNPTGYEQVLEQAAGRARPAWCSRGNPKRTFRDTSKWRYRPRLSTRSTSRGSVTATICRILMRT